MSTRGTRALAIGCCTAVLVLAVAPSAGAADIPSVPAERETPTQFDDDAGGNADADDPAIWRNNARPDKSLVITTAKEGGLKVYDLQAREVQAVPVVPGPTPDSETGRYNNVDLIYGVPFPDGKADVAVVSDRGRDRIRSYRINPASTTAPLTDVTAADVPRVFSPTEEAVEDQNTAYGLGTFQRNGRYFAITSQRNTTTVALVELAQVAGKITYSPVRKIDLPATFTLPNGTTWAPCDEPGARPQVEGIVVDPATNKVYLGQEAIGIWKLASDLTGSPKLVDKTREFGLPGTYDPETDECTDGPNPGFGGTHLARDVEGLTIYDDGNGEGYLLASSQGDNTFVAYDREGANAFEASFRIGPGRSIDGAEESDGAMVSSASFGSAFPDGLLVVQDGSDTPEVTGPDGEPRDTSNFKFVDWEKVADAADLDD